MTRSEATFQAALERALNAPRRPTRVWRQQAGRVRVADRWVRLAPAGAADLTGEVAPLGLRLEIEVKAASGRQSASQRRWQARCERVGVVYVCVHDLAGATLPVSVAAAVARIDAEISRARLRLSRLLGGDACS